MGSGPAEQLLVSDHLAELRHIRLAHHHHRLHRGQRGPDRREQRSRAGVDDDHAIAAVIDDEGELRRGEAEVEGVEHGAEAGRRKVGLQVLLVVPAEGPDPVARADAQAPKPGGEPTDTVGGIPEAAPPRGLTLEGDQLAVREDGPAPPEDLGDGERDVLHGAQHRRGAPQKTKRVTISATQHGLVASRAAIVTSLLTRTRRPSGVASLILTCALTSLPEGSGAGNRARSSP